MPDKPIDLEEFIAWLRATIPTMHYGQVGIVFIIREGQLRHGTRIYEETWKDDLCSNGRQKTDTLP